MCNIQIEVHVLPVIDGLELLASIVWISGPSVDCMEVVPTQTTWCVYLHVANVDRRIKHEISLEK